MPMAYNQFHIKLQWVVLAFLLTVMAYMAYDLLPLKRFQLLENGYPTLYSDPSSQASWTGPNFDSFRCTYSRPESYAAQYCGFDYALGDGLTRGLDLRSYDQLILRFSYSGPSSIVRFYMRNYDPRYSDPLDSVLSAKYNRVMIQSNDLPQEISINFSKLSVADWWMSGYRIHPEFADPQFDNVTHLGIDAPAPQPDSAAHNFTIHSVTATKALVSRTVWNTGLAVIWIISLLAVSYYKYRVMKAVARLNYRKLENEQRRNDHLQKESMRYKQISMQDQLTGLLNRNGLHYVIDFNTRANDTALLLIDIDHFKKINDRWGHDAGDHALIRVGQVIRENVRGVDSVGRWGGEELLVICPMTNCMGGYHMAEKIRIAIEKEFSKQDSPFPLTVSIGVGARDISEEFQDTFKRVDVALYAAKKTGRNSTAIAETPVAVLKTGTSI